MKASFPYLVGEHRTETVPPEPYRLVTDVDAPLNEQIFDLPQRQRIADIHHHREADHLGRAVEIAEGISHRRRLENLARWLKPIYSDNALGRTVEVAEGIAHRRRLRNLARWLKPIYSDNALIRPVLEPASLRLLAPPSGDCLQWLSSQAVCRRSQSLLPGNSRL